MKYGRWTIIEDGIKNGNSIYCRCLCDCGKEKLIQRSNLISGKSKSCGCLQKELLSQKRKKVNNYIIDDENNIVIGKATNTTNKFIIDLDDFDKIKEISWFETSVGYMAHKGKGKVILLHRIIANAPDNMVVDHINHNRMDNRKQNLSVCSQHANCRNRLKEPKGITEICRNNNIYFIVQLFGKYYGCFKKYDDAKKVRDEIVKEKYDSWKKEIK